MVSLLINRTITPNCTIIFSGAEDCKCTPDAGLLSYAKNNYCYMEPLLVNDDYKVYADAVCASYGLNYPPTTHEDALFLYLLLKDDIDSLDQQQ